MSVRNGKGRKGRKAQFAGLLRVIRQNRGMAMVKGRETGGEKETTKYKIQQEMARLPK